MSVIVVYGVL